MTEGYYDMHCHILPGVDDGAKTPEEAIQMLRISRQEGIRHVVLTPHFHRGHYESTPALLKQKYEELNALAAREIPDMRLYLGNEICYSLDAAERLAKGQVLTLGDTQCVLVEFFPDSELRTIRNGLQEIQMLGKQPILAHMERYKTLVGDYQAVESLVHMGFYMQINTSAVTGKDGFRIKQFVKKLLSYELVHLIGTDAHGAERRRPAMKECAAYIEKKWGRDYAQELLVRNPEKVLRGEYL